MNMGMNMGMSMGMGMGMGGMGGMGNSGFHMQLSVYQGHLSATAMNPELAQQYKKLNHEIADLKDKIKRELSKSPTDRNFLSQFVLSDDHKTIEDVNDNGRRPIFKERKPPMKGHFGKINCVDWSLNSQDIVSASQDGKLLIWNAITGNKKIAIPLRSNWVMTCAFSSQHNFVASGGLDNLVSVFNIDAESYGWGETNVYCELNQHEGYISCVKFRLKNENELLSSSGDGSINLWDLNHKMCTQVFNDHKGDVQYISTHPTHPDLFASGAIDMEIKIWDIRQHECVTRFTGHENDINDVRWFPDGNAVISGSDDGTIRLFDQKAHKQLNKYQLVDSNATVTSCDFSKSGKYIFAGYDDDPHCIIWDTLTAGYDSQKGTLPHEQRISSIKTSPDGYSVATGSWDRVLRIWN